MTKRRDAEAVKDKVEDGKLVEANDENLEIAVEVPEDSGAGEQDTRPSEPDEDDFEVEISEDEPLDELKRKYAEVTKRQEEHERQLAEKERLIRAHEAKVREQATHLERAAATELAGHKAVLEQMYDVEEAKSRDIKRRYEEALRNAEYGVVVQCQDDLYRVNATMHQYATAYQQLLNHEQQSQVKRPAVDQDPFEQAVRTMEPRVADWARSHKEDLLKPDRQRLALAADQMAQARGYQIGSEDYLDYMNETLGYSRGEEVNDTTEQNNRAATSPVTAKPARPQPNPQPRPRLNYSAPSRPSGRSSVTVNLSKADRELAESMSMTPEEYAPYVKQAREKWDSEMSTKFNKFKG